MSRFIILTVLALFFTNAQADLKWPVVTNFTLETKIEMGSGGGFIQWWDGKYDVTWSTIYIPESVRNMPISERVWSFGVITIIPSNPKLSSRELSPIVHPKCQSSCTWGELSDLFYEEYAESGTITSTASVSNIHSMYSGIPVSVCSGMTPFEQNDSIKPYAPIAGLSECLAVINNSYTSCAFKDVDATLEFDFGPLVTNSASGQSINKNIEVECVKDPSDYAGKSASFKLLSVKGDDITLSNGMMASLTINDEKLSKYKQKITNGVFPLNIGVSLSGTPTRSGPFSGDTTIIMSYN